MQPDRFYITTPIYYVNDRPHTGHAYTSVLADVLAGYHRMLGVPTWFLTGTDEHGQKVQDAATAAGVSPQALCDEMSQRFRELLVRLEIANDDFIRTTEPRHVEVVKRVLSLLFERGEIYLGTYEGWYCARCERYWTDKEVEEHGGRCPDQPELHEVARLAEENYYFRMGRYAEPLRAAIESGELRVLPEKRKNEVLGFLAQGVNDLCISRNRERLQWGVPLPFDDRYVCYVWVDALFNYASAIGYLTEGEEERFERWWPADVHLIGKDILTTHSVYWPTMLLAVGLPLPRRIVAHGWLLDPKGRKLSKTKAADEAELRPPPTIEGLVEVFGVAGARWFLATAMKPGDDCAYDWEIVRERVNSDLANGFGNTANRLLKMAGSTCDARFPGLGEAGAAERALVGTAEAALAAARAVPETLDVTSIVAAARLGIDAISAYLTEEQPWKLAKDPATAERAGQVLAWSLEALRLLALSIHPILPGPMNALRAALGLSGQLDFARESRVGALAAGAPLAGPPNLFPRIAPEDLPQS